MGVRKEEIRIHATSNLATQAAKDAAALKLLTSVLKDLGASSADVDRITQRTSRGGLGSLSRDAVSSERSIRQLDSGINNLTGRLRLAGQVALTLGPALIPMAGLAVPAIAGIAAQLSIAAAAGSSALLAFQGVGEALTSIEAARLDPTAENLQKMRDALSELSPQAREFAREVGRLRPAIAAATVDASAEGFFPGLLEGMDDLESALPRIESFFNELGTVTGDLAGDTLASLTGERWQSFFNYIQNNARPILTDLVGTVGDVTHGLAELVMAFDPTNQDFSSWLRVQAGDFDDWAAGLSKTEGFREFVAYLQQNGPEVAEAASAIGGALVDIATAAAPLGGPALNGLEAVAKAVSAIADSPVGTPLIQAAAGMILFNKAVAAGAGAAGFFAKTRGNAAAMNSTIAGSAGGVGRLAGSLAAAGAAATILGNGLAEATGAKIDLGNLTRDLDALTKGADTKLLDQVGNSLEYMAGWQNKAAEPIREVFSAFGLFGNTPMDNAVDNIESVDQALAQMVESGNAGKAEKAMQRILQAATGAPEGASIAPWAREEVMANFGAYQTALDNAAGGNGRYADSANEAGDAASGAGQSIGEMTRALWRQKEAALGAFDAQTAWGQSLADAEEAAAKGARGISSHTEAGRENRTLLSGMASSWNGMSNAVKQNTDRYYSARDAFVRVATQMTGNEQAAKRLARRYLDMPKKVVSRLALEGERQTRQGLDNTTRRVERLNRQRARPRVEPQTRRGDQMLSRFDSRMREIGGRRPTPVVGANSRPGMSTINGMDNRLRQLDRTKTNPGVGADIGEAMRKTGQARDELNRFGSLRPSPAVGINDNASGPLSGIRAMMASIQSKTVTVTVQTRQVRANAAGGYYPSVAGRHQQAPAFAAGGIRKELPRTAEAILRERIAAGDYANGHRAQMVAGGPTRVWAEPETKGESYIPHANDWRRPGAKAILEQTAGILGGQVEWYARGGLRRRQGVEASLRAQEAEYQRREAERHGVMAALRSGGGGGYSGPSTVQISGPVHLKGTLNTPWGPAQVEGIAEAAAERVLQNQRSNDSFARDSDAMVVYDGSGV
ncbi:hypothetical protein [uncultured Nocardioides sp.]|uniref:hypothetical protein n=1 Tax=uncultured Nocardioides sp. TaxID=198441 RepID=UPI002608F5D4|nr:hypothetical protein [uncultured Nocardioides sp.]